MDIKILDKKTDMQEINSWLPFQTTPEDLPGHTFCALYNGKIAAIAGLRLVEGPLCFFDSMATDPRVPGKIRNQALDELTITVLEKAKSLGFKYIKACTKEPCILERAQRHGFEFSSQVIIVKEL